MEIIPGAPAGAGKPAAAAVIESNTAKFMTDVIEASMAAPVIVDFWAPWCGPCKQLGPILEKVVGESKGAVRMVKINVDENQDLAAQLRIQSIPMVYAFSKGRPVDGFQGALPESQVRTFVERLIKTTGATRTDPIQDALDEAAEQMEAGQIDVAIEIYQQVLEHEADNLTARAGLARGLIEQKELEGAREVLAGVPEDKREEAAVAAALAALELAEKSSSAVADLSGLIAAVTEDPANHQARYDLALALYGNGEPDAAIDHLVEIVKRDKAWNDQAARKQLLQFFEARGATDPVTVAGRRKLSAVLFS
ncbi:MAG: thioredoxin [Rhodospirillales bacterium]